MIPLSGSLRFLILYVTRKLGIAYDSLVNAAN